MKLQILPETSEEIIRKMSGKSSVIPLGCAVCTFRCTINIFIEKFCPIQSGI